jgi:hypothetical protein
VFGYLLKHAHLALEHRAQAALADVGVTVRDLGVLRDRRAQALGTRSGGATSSRSPTTAGRYSGRQRAGTPRPCGTSRRHWSGRA